MTALSRTPEQMLEDLRFRIAEIQHGLAVLVNLTDWLNWRVAEAERLLCDLTSENRSPQSQFPHLPPAQTA